MNHRTVVVIGAGTMGSGIGGVAAVAGFSVQLVDRPTVHGTSRSRIERFLEGQVKRGRLGASEQAGALRRISWRDEIGRIDGVDLVLEAVVEDLGAKAELFSALDRGFSGLVATNTSSLSVSALAEFAPDPSRFLGLHFFNPPERMALVEVVSGAKTSKETLAAGQNFVRQIGKEAACTRDSPGFIVNRVARPIYLEALRLVGDKVASVESLDRLVEGLGFPLGPFRLMDLIGIDVNLAVSESVYRQLGQEPRLRPHPLQRKMVAERRLGRKSGEGFYTYA